MTLLRVAEVADRLKVTRAAIYGWIKEGRLASIRIGERVVRVSEEEFQAFLQREGKRKDVR